MKSTKILIAFFVILAMLSMVVACREPAVNPDGENESTSTDAGSVTDETAEDNGENSSVEDATSAEEDSSDDGDSDESSSEDTSADEDESTSDDDSDESDTEQTISYPVLTNRIRLIFDFVYYLVN